MGRPQRRLQSNLLQLSRQRRENAQLKRELTQLKAQMKKINHDLSQENAILQDKLSKAEKASAAMAQELADLREIVFNQQREVCRRRRKSLRKSPSVSNRPPRDRIRRARFVAARD